MFKGTKSIAKVLALVLAICMLPMAAFAEAPTAKTVSITTTAEAAAAAYQAGDAIEIAGETTSETVTILAVRSLSAAESTELVSGSEIWEKVVFAGQKAVADGTFSFKFFPMTGVTGSTMTVFVGGEGVSELASISFEVAEPAPRFSVNWVIGEDLTLTLSRVTGEDATLWLSKVDTFKLNDVEFDVSGKSIVDNKITFTAAELEAESIETLSSIYVSTVDGEYSTIEMTGLAFPTLKPAGTLSFTYPTGQEFFVARPSARVDVAAADDAYGAGWLAALSASEATVKYNGASAAYRYESNVLTVHTDYASDFVEGNGVITVEVADYEVATSATIAFKAPAPLDAALITELVDEPTGTFMEGAPSEDAELYGKYAVSLPSSSYYGSTITWEVKVDEGDYAVAVGEYEVVRPAVDGADSAKYTFKAMLTGVGQDAEAGPFVIEVNKYGQPVHGHGAPSIEDVTITPAPTENKVIAGVELTAEAVNPYDNKNLEVIVTYEWTVEGKAPVAGATFTPAVADLGKTLTLTATPSVEATAEVTENLVGEAVVKTLTIILDPSYVPTVAVAIDGNVTAGSTAAATATYDQTYAADATFASEFSWFYVPAENAEDAIAKVVAADGSVVAVAGGAFDENACGKYAVVKAVATYTIAGQALEAHPTAYAAVLVHAAPSIEDVTVAPAVAESNVIAGVTYTAEAVNPFDNKGHDVTVTYVWSVEGGASITRNNYTPAVADIGKTLTLTVTPAVAEEAPFEGTPVVKTFTIILDPTYVPTVSVAISGNKVTAGATATATATYDETYAADAEFETEYTWYLVPASAVSSSDDKLAAAIALVEGGDPAVVEVADGAYDKAAAKNYAVVKGVATYTIVGNVLTTEPAYAAVLVTAKSSGGSTGGAFLPGAEKPADPTPSEPTEPTEPSESEDPVSGDPVANGAAAFTDVNKETYAWAYDGIDALAKAGVFKGMTPTTFGPELTTTNAQVIALAVRIAGLKAADGATTDKVAADHWVFAEMAAADAAGILGVFGGNVAVEDATTREVAFTLLYNALKAAGVELAETAEAIEYSDASSISEACVEAITALTKAGIVNGMGDGTLAPKATITRAQLAKILGIAQTLIK